jgi:hypothetical protein
MLNNGNNDREHNLLLLSPRVKRAQSDWRATVTLGCPRCVLPALEHHIYSDVEGGIKINGNFF